MKEYEILLIDYPDFFVEINNSNKIINFNKKFWKYIFLSENLKKNIDFYKLSKNEKKDLAFIFTNLKLAYQIFGLFKYKNIGINALIFAFNIIDTYLKIIEKFSGGIIVKFYDYFHILDEAYINKKETILYKFYNEKIDFLKELKDNDCLKISIKFSHQIFQLKIIDEIIKKLGKKNHFKIYLGDLIEFENKLEFKKILESQFKNIVNIDILKKGQVSIKKILGNNYFSIKFFGDGCSWRKCAFCNIGKFEKVYSGKNLDERIKILINNIKNNNIKFINISDPSMEFDYILKFCKYIIKENIEIYMHIRIRFTKKFTKENCNILAKAGVKFIGIGLETASIRLNKIMNKYSENYNIKDFQQFINNCLDNNINLHLYTIFGFPTETKEEIILTENLLQKNININNFFSFTAGTFGLNRGTDVYDNPQKYGINFLNKKDVTETHLSSYVIDDKEYIDNTIEQLYKKLFFGKNDVNIDVRSFWHFIEESKIFHILKLTNEKNPFLNNFKNEYNINNKVNRLKYLYFDKNNLIITNWLTKSYIKCSKSDFIFLYYYDNSISLIENIKIQGYKGNNLKIFFKKYLLIKI